MAEYIKPLEILIEQFRKLPGVGKKSATRMAFGIVDMSDDDVGLFVNAISKAKSEIRICKICGNLSEDEICPICSDTRRNSSVICVVEDVKALIAMERVRDFNGVYHILGGTISPINGKGPDDINISSLLSRVNNTEVSEVIIATNATIDGETTALYIANLLKPCGIRTTRIAYGIPVGADLDYADEMTLLRAINGRKEI